MIKGIIGQNKRKNQNILKFYESIELKYRKILSLISPTMSSKYLYKRRFGKPLKLNNPRSLNEKFMWLKLNTYNHNPLINICVDKYRVKEYVRQKGLSDILNTFIGKGVYNSVSEIPWTDLPNQFVVKCTHGSGYIIICKNKKDFNIEDAKVRLNKWMKEDYSLIYSEIQYKYIEKKIIIEKYLGNYILAIKFYCFNGKPEFAVVCKNIGEKKDIYNDFYDMNWHKLNFISADHDTNPKIVEKPQNLKKMISITEILSEDFPFVRVDLFNINNKIFFSELTFIPYGGLMKFIPPEIDDKLGSLLSGVPPKK